MDLDALREALGHGYRATLVGPRRIELKGFTLEELDPVFAAARAVLDSEEAWRCETHDSDRMDERTCYKIALWLGFRRDGSLDEPTEFEESPEECKFAPVAVVRVRLLAEEKL